MRIIIYYDPGISDGATLARCYEKHIHKDSQTIDKDGKPHITKDFCHIDFLNSRIDFIPFHACMHGLRADIALVPEHMKESKNIDVIIRPMMLTPFLGYYNQIDIARNN